MNDRILQTVRYRFNKARLVQHYKGRCCDCKQAYPPCVFQFDHPDPLLKRGHRTAKTYSNGLTSVLRKSDWDAILRYVAGCEMVCANCHMIRSYLVRDHGDWQRTVRDGKNAERAEGYGDNGPVCAYSDETIESQYFVLEEP